MENLIGFIMNGATEFTPEVLIRYMVFVLVLSCISDIAYSLSNVGRK